MEWHSFKCLNEDCPDDHMMLVHDGQVLGFVDPMVCPPGLYTVRTPVKGDLGIFMGSTRAMEFLQRGFEGRSAEECLYEAYLAAAMEAGIRTAEDVKSTKMREKMIEIFQQAAERSVQRAMESFGEIR